MGAPVHVEIWSDVVCPWCAIGKVRFERALARMDAGDEVTVRYRSFELDPTTPRVVEGAYVDRLATKYRTSPAQAQAMIDRMTAQAAAEGLAFDFARVRPGNTFDAHRLLHLAAERGSQHALKGRLLTGYLSEGAAIGTHEALRSLALEAGLDDAEVRDTLAGDAYGDAVRADERQARAYGITGVPFFVIDGRFGVSGAQPSDVLWQALAQVRAASRDGDDAPADAATSAHHGHDPRACADGSCALA
jgi:predicted DsbA family dithiol-disulfide isomerase